MQVEQQESVVSLAGTYEVAPYRATFDVDNARIIHRGANMPAGLATSGLSGCYGIAVFGGHTNNDQVAWLSMFHGSGGVGRARLDEYLAHLQLNVPAPGQNFEWVVVFSQGDEEGQTGNWTELGQAGNATLHGVNPSALYLLDGPAPGGAQSAFAIDFDGHWGRLGGNIINEPNWKIWSWSKDAQVQVGNPANQRGCCALM